MKLRQIAVPVLTGSFLLCSGVPSRAFDDTQTRSVGAFDAIVLGGAARLEIAVGAAQSLVLEGDDALLRQIVTEVRGNTLYIGREPDEWRSSRRFDRSLVVRVALPRLTSLELSGSSNASVTGLASDSASVALHGSNELTAHGQLGRLTLRVNGSARADLSDVAVDDATVTVNGSGDVLLQPHRSLVATVRGSGRVTYAGEPIQVTANTHGSGTVERR